MSAEVYVSYELFSASLWSRVIKLPQRLRSPLGNQPPKPALMMGADATPITRRVECWRFVPDSPAQGMLRVLLVQPIDTNALCW